MTPRFTCAAIGLLPLRHRLLLVERSSFCSSPERLKSTKIIPTAPWSLALFALARSVA